MSIRREGPVTERLLKLLQEHPGADPARQGGLDEPIAAPSPMTRRQAVAIFESAIQSRLQDLLSRELKDKGISYYTIGSSGHEANAIYGAQLRTSATTASGSSNAGSTQTGLAIIVAWRSLARSAIAAWGIRLLP